MGSVSKFDDVIAGLRVVRGQVLREGFVGTVVDLVGNKENQRKVKVLWDSGEESDHPIGDTGDVGDLHVLDNSSVKHPGIKCQGCDQEDIVGLRWQCMNCKNSINLCTFCMTNRKHDQSHNFFRRFDGPTSDPIVVPLDEKPKIQLKGFFCGALVRRGNVWKYGDEDGGSGSVGKVVPSPNGQHGGTPGKVWVQWSHEKGKSYSYRVGMNGQMDLKMVLPGVGGYYQPHQLPKLKISWKPMTEAGKANLPLVVGDAVQFDIPILELRDIIVDSGLEWEPAKMEKVVKEVGEVKVVDDTKNIVKVAFSTHSQLWFPKKVVKRVIPWLPVNSVVKVSSGPDMLGYFGRVRKVHDDGLTVVLQFLECDETKTIAVSNLEKEIVDSCLVRKVESFKKKFSKLLVSEMEKEKKFSVEYLIKNFPVMVKSLLQKEESGIGPIHHALRNHPEILKQLQENGTSNVINKKTSTLAVESSSEDEEVEEISFQDITQQTKQQPLPSSLQQSDTTADTSTIQLAGNSLAKEKSRVITCSIEKGREVQPRNGSLERERRWILIDEQTKRYSECNQANGTSLIFRCTNVVPHPYEDKRNRCEGEIVIEEDSDFKKLDDLKKDKTKNHQFQLVIEHHEECRGIQSEETPSKRRRF